MNKLLGLVLALSCSLFAQHPSAETSVTKASSAYAAAFEEARAHGGMKAALTFVTDRIVSVTSVIGKGHNRSELTADFFQLNGKKLTVLDQQQFAANTSNSQLVPLSTGGYLVNLGDHVVFFQSDRRRTTEATLASLCGATELTVSEGFDLVAELRVPNQAGVAVLFTDESDQNKESYLLRGQDPHDYRSHFRFCWFQTDTGAPIRQLTGVPIREDQNDSQMEMAIIAAGGVVTPAGFIPKAPTCADDHNHWNDYAMLLRGALGGIKLCSTSGALTGMADGKLVQRPGRGKDRPMIIGQASSASRVLLLTPFHRFGVTGQKYGGRVTVFDYSLNRDVFELSLEALPREPEFRMPLKQFALSPNGKRLAVLSDSHLLVYDIDWSRRTGQKRIPNDKSPYHKQSGVAGLLVIRALRNMY